MLKRDMAHIARMAYIKMQIDDILPNEVYEIYVKPNFATASWRFYQDKHQIVIGANIFKNSAHILNETQKIEYLKSYLHHELAHSIWSEKDLKFLNDQLFVEAIPFELFNLFEDARIEEQMRSHLKKLFKWTEYELLATPTNSLGIFFYLLQSEHQKKSLVELKNKIGISLHKDFNTVLDFYKRALKSTNSLQLIPLLREWIKKFPETIKYIQIIKKEGHLFCEESQYTTDDKKFDELLSDAINITSEYLPQETKSKVKSIRERAKASSRGTLLHPHEIKMPFNEKQRDMLLVRMKKLFYEPLRLISTRVPAKRVNLKRLPTGSEKIFKKKDAPKLLKKKITIILDLSGSMQCVIENMRLLIDVMDKMSSKGLIDATLILTANKYGATYEVLQMPLKKGTISRIVPFSSTEGLENSMKSNIELLSSSDYVWILTDGYIDEEPLNKNYFASHGVKTHAMYIGDTSCKEEMKKSFDHVICEESVEGLAEKIFTLIK